MRFKRSLSTRFHRHSHTALLIALVGLLAGALLPDAARAQTGAPEAFIGSWAGTFDIGGDEARPVFHIERAETTP